MAAFIAWHVPTPSHSCRAAKAKRIARISASLSLRLVLGLSKERSLWSTLVQSKADGHERKQNL